MANFKEKEQKSLVQPTMHEISEAKRNEATEVEEAESKTGTEVDAEDEEVNNVKDDSLDSSGRSHRSCLIIHVALTRHFDQMRGRSRSLQKRHENWALTAVIPFFTNGTLLFITGSKTKV